MMLYKFYAVTEDSMYEVECCRGRASALKIAGRGERKISRSANLVEDGCMLAICEHLQAYIPASSEGSVERRMEHVPTTHWRYGSSPIVALFKTKSRAAACFKEPGLRPSDRRWAESTRRVLADIGEGNFAIYICRHPNHALQLTS